LESIADPERRALCERRALKLAREFTLNRRSITSTAAVRQLAKIVLQG
jgi:5-methylthioribose kinase